MDSIELRPKPNPRNCAIVNFLCSCHSFPEDRINPLWLPSWKIVCMVFWGESTDYIAHISTLENSYLWPFHILYLMSPLFRKKRGLCMTKCSSEKCLTFGIVEPSYIKQHTFIPFFKENKTMWVSFLNILLEHFTKHLGTSLFLITDVST